MKKIKSPEKELIDQMYNMVIDNIYKTSHQIFFNPTKEQAKKFWCDNCDGFHKTQVSVPRDNINK
jgi:hypothetical protein